MAASYPVTVPVYTPKLDDQIIEPEHVNALQEEIAAVVDGLLNGVAHNVVPDASAGNRDLGLTGQRFRNLWLSGTATIPTLAVTGTSTFTGTATFNGSVVFSTALTFPDGTVSDPGITFTNDDDTGFYREGANRLSAGTGGVKALEIDATQFIDSPTQPRASVFHSAAHSVATGTPTALPFDSEDVDVGAMHTSNESKITIPTGGTGVYLVGGAAKVAQIATTVDASIYLRKNGTTPISTEASHGPTGASFRGAMHVLTLVNLTAGDYVELIATHGSAGNIDFGGATRDTSNSMFVVKLW